MPIISFKKGFERKLTFFARGEANVCSVLSVNVNKLSGGRIVTVK